MFDSPLAAALRRALPRVRAHLEQEVDRRPGRVSVVRGLRPTPTPAPSPAPSSVRSSTHLSGQCVSMFGDKLGLCCSGGGGGGDGVALVLVVPLQKTSEFRKTAAVGGDLVQILQYCTTFSGVCT